ncbi:MAG: substrate-binding domain-containing protein [Bacteroidota bacterium]|nr:substrate-binding domain-containing protein [Bacteroidota bacterium]
MRFLFHFLAAAGLTAIFSGCEQGSKKPVLTDTPISGKINIVIDESLKLLGEAEVEVFEHIYKKADLVVAYKSEEQAIADLFNDRAKLAIVARRLTEAEEKKLKEMNMSARTTKIAYDAVALIAHPGNPVQGITQENLEKIFTGKIIDWKQVNPSFSGKINVVFDHPRSSTVRYLKETFKMGDSLPANFFAANSHEELIKYVAANEGALGVIGVSWVSDPADSTSHSFLKSVRILGVSPDPAMKAPYPFYEPYQGYIYQGYYPLYREVYVISRERRAGLASGFAAFVAGEKGQLIIKRLGLLPAQASLRLNVQFTE